MYVCMYAYVCMCEYVYLCICIYVYIIYVYMGRDNPHKPKQLVATGLIFLILCVFTGTQTCQNKLCLDVFMFMWMFPSLATPNPPTNIVGFRGLDSSIILMLTGGILRPIGNFPESLNESSNVSRGNASREIGRMWRRGQRARCSRAMLYNMLWCTNKLCYGILYSIILYYFISYCNI